MIRRSVILILSIHLLAACQSPSNEMHTGGQQMTPYQWLLGEWHVPGGNYIEAWQSATDTSFSGRAFRVEDGDTVTLENISLIKSGNDLIYRPVLIRGDDTIATDFKQRNRGMDTLSFENAQHDFPQMIYYEKVGADSIFIYIQGVDQDGVTSRKYFSMKRAQNGRAKTD